uniref:Type I-U CRISPR-associated helicase/endonuclease Cas3 n=1 Tax=Candidatus Caldatribacterium californiense TaxID=1454726 RepID=A0A7V4DGB6_9BACT
MSLEYFKDFTGYEPFEWQKNFFNQLLRGNLPARVDIPTGCGKTKIMLIWLLALAEQVKEGKIRLPRRLVWIVNRRVVVDQATQEARKIVEKLKEKPEIYGLLSSLSASGEKAVAVSTLRGELADNEEWKEDPSRPAIIVGTVDMIGSKLLFRGYGDGRWKRSYHAGLLGVDSLIVLDEAQLVPAFEKTLERVKEIHAKYRQLKPFHVMFLSATLRRREEAFTWSQEDLKNQEFKRRVEARKTLRLHAAKKVQQKIIELAERYGNEKTRVVIFVYKPKDAVEIANSLRKKFKDQVILLTGQIRGYERDRLVEKETFKSFLLEDGPKAINRTLFFVATSAGEIGIDLDGDHCICDLTTIDSLIQRWGRVNRGGRGHSLIELVYPEGDGEYFKGPLGEARRATLELLKKLDGGDVSPASLAKLQIPKEAFSPVPFSPDLTETELELWSMTSVPNSKLEPKEWFNIEYWLLGSEEEEPETFLLWRDDVRYLSKYLEKREETRVEERVGELLESFHRPLSKEKLRVPTSEFKEFLGKFKSLEKAGEEPEEKKNLRELLDLGAIVMTRYGRFICKRIKDLEEEDLEFAQVFLPSEVGGLNEEGYLDPERIGEVAKDVADEVVPEKWVDKELKKEERMRLLFEWGERGCTIRKLGGLGGVTEEPEHKPESYRELEDYLKREYRDWSWRKFVTERIGDEPVQCLVYLRRQPEDPESLKTRVPISLEDHEREIEKLARNISNKLGLEEGIVEALSQAARLHDEGKRNVSFQKDSLGNSNPSERNLWAKSTERNFVRSGFRHEVGSLLIALRNQVNDDLVLHLIASSHGWSRPHFEEKVFTSAAGEYVGIGQVTPREVEEARERCLPIFSNLQRKYGYWNLAYLESLLKAADVLVSRREAEKT